MQLDDGDAEVEILTERRLPKIGVRGANDADVCAVVTCDGGFAVPKKTS